MRTWAYSSTLLLFWLAIGGSVVSIVGCSRSIHQESLDSIATSNGGRTDYGTIFNKTTDRIEVKLKDGKKLQLDMDSSGYFVGDKVRIVRRNGFVQKVEIEWLP